MALLVLLAWTIMGIEPCRRVYGYESGNEIASPPEASAVSSAESADRNDRAKDTEAVSAQKQSESGGEDDYKLEEADILEEELPIIEIGSQSASDGAIGSQQSIDREPKPEGRKGEEKR